MAGLTESAATLQLLRFYLGGDCYCLETHHIGAIRRWEETGAPLTGMPGAIASVPVGRRAVPVYSLRELLGLDITSRSVGPVFVVGSQERPFGVQVERVARAVSVAASAARQLPRVARDREGRVRGVVRLGQEPALLLSAACLPPMGARTATATDAELPPQEPWAASPPPQNGQRLLCFSEPSGDKTTLFGFSLRQMIEIAYGLRVIPLGANDSCVIGLTDWRGHIVPVIDPGSMLGVSRGKADLRRAKFAVLRGSRTRELFALPANTFAALTLPLAPSVGLGAELSGLGPYVRSAYEVNGGCLVLPDLDRLVA